MNFNMQELVEFAKKNSEKFKDFSDETIMVFFDQYAKSTVIRQDKQGVINGFCVMISKGKNEIDIVTTCLIGTKQENFRDMRQFLNRWKSVGIRATWKRENSTSNVFGLLADIYDRSVTA